MKIFKYIKYVGVRDQEDQFNVIYQFSIKRYRINIKETKTEEMCNR